MRQLWTKRGVVLQLVGGSLIVVGVGFGLGWWLGSVVAGSLVGVYGIAEER